MDTDFLAAIKEEIALEGLDGITIDGLWVRLADRHNFSIKLTDKAKVYLWRCLVTLEGLQYYELPESRPPLLVYNSLESYDPDSGRLIEPEDVPADIYPVEIICKDGVFGSCPTYETRKNVTSLVQADDEKPAVTLDDAKQKWGQTLVIVASQEMRLNAICGQLYDPAHDWSSMSCAYAILERVGRSRYNGCMSMGPHSLHVFSLPPKSMFYHTKNLVNLGLIKKQSLTVVDTMHKQQTRRILHLERFYKEILSKYNILLQQTCDYLVKQPHHRELSRKMREYLDMEALQFKKLYHTYPNFLRSDKMSYREFNPEASEEEYMCKSRALEKQVHVVTMLQHPSVKKEEEEEDEDEEDGEGVEDDLQTMDTGGQGAFKWVYGRTILQQCYDAIKSVGPEGITQSQLARLFNVTDPMSRTLLKNMNRMKLVDVIFKEMGKQKARHYIAIEHRQESKLYQEFEEEKGKIFLKKEPADLATNVESQADTGPVLSSDTAAVNTITENLEISMDTSELTAVPDAEADEINVKLEGHSSQSTLAERGDESRTVDEVEYEPPKPSKYTKLRRHGFIDKRSDITTMLTSRHLKRMSMILEAIEKDKVLEKTHTFIKMIREREKSMGLDSIIDKHTFNKLTMLLVKEKKIRIFKTTILGNHDQRKEVELLCAKYVQPTDAIIKSKLEQLQLRSRCVPKERLLKTGKKSPKQQRYTELPESTKENLKKMHEYRLKIKSLDMVYDSTAPRLYGCLPKIQKNRMTHNILWYLCYDYKGGDGPLPPNQSPGMSVSTSEKNSSVPMATQQSDAGSWPDTLATLQSTELPMETNPPEGQGQQRAKDSQTSPAENPGKEATDEASIFDQIKNLKEPPVFCDEMTWRRYLPPLPLHKDYPTGWCLISDVLVTLPVCVFCSLVPITYQLIGLKEILDDPVKSLYPIVYLPYKLTQQLLFARKYIYAFYENCERLASMGLLSFGMRLLKEKDQVFVYLYKHACLWDTTPSLDGYRKIQMPEGMTCKRLAYTLDSQQEFDHYWTDLQSVCFGSHLNVRKMRNSPVEQTEQEPVDLSLSAAQLPINPADIVDNGTVCRIPGNRLGAAGLDSSFYGHLCRNWDWTLRPPKRKHLSHMTPLDLKPTGLWSSMAKSPRKSGVEKFLKVSKPNRLPRILPKERLMLTDSGTGKGPEVVKVTTAETKGNKGGKGIKRKKKTQGVTEIKKKKVEKLKAVTMTVKRKKVFRDDIDIEAMSLRTGQRVSWSAKEDSILLTCKIALTILSMGSPGYHRSIPIPFHELRNTLHKFAKEKSKDKSTEACKRRITFILKNPRSEQNLSVFLSEALQDPKIDKEYARKKVTWMTDETIRDFQNLFELLLKKFSSVDLKQSSLPSNLSELPEYNVKIIRKMDLNEMTHSDVSTTSDIYIAVLRNIILTYAALDDKQGRVYECYKLLNQYPKDSIITATTQLRAKAIITRLKMHEVKKHRIPSTLQNYKISQRYWYEFLSRFPPSLFEESMDYLHLLEESHQDPTQYLTHNNITKGGYCACIIAMMSLGVMSFHTQIPRDIIILDPCNEQPNRGSQETCRAKQPSVIVETIPSQVPMETDQAVQISSEFLEAVTEETETTGKSKQTVTLNLDQETASTSTSKMLDQGQETVQDSMPTREMPDQDLETVQDSTLTREMPDQGQETVQDSMPTREMPDQGLETVQDSTLTSEMTDQGQETVQDSMPTKEMPDHGLETVQDSMPTREMPDQGLEMVQDAAATSDNTKAGMQGGSASWTTGHLVQVVISDTSCIEMEDLTSQLSFPDPTERQRQQPTPSRSLITIRRSCVEDAENLKHFKFQDNFVIASCNIRLKIKEGTVEGREGQGRRTVAEVMTDALLTTEEMKRVARKWTLTLPFELDMDVVWESVAPPLLEPCQEMYNLIDSHGCLGISKFDLQAQFGDEDWYTVGLAALTDKFAVLRVGVTIPRYVTFRNARPWVTHAYKNIKGRGIRHQSEVDDSLDPIPGPSGDAPSDPLRQDSTPDKGDRDETDKGENSDSHEKGDNLGEPARGDGPGSAEASQKDVLTRKKREPKKSSPREYDTATPQPTSTYQRVRLLCSPWRKPEGNISKLIFKTMVKSMMFKIMASPGISFQSLSETYATSNTPYVKLQILEILEDIGAVEKTIIRKVTKTSLFSKRTELKIVNLDKENDTVVYFPTKVCVARLGQYLDHCL